MMRTGRDRLVEAHANPEMAGAATALAASRTNVRRGSFIGSSLVSRNARVWTLMFPERFIFQKYIAARQEGRVKKAIRHDLRIGS
ncbi:MAG: hypothetical protein K2Y71_22280 [Xanthobacteraceae bacterium]|nr:hypothetical protein [Xanthobacteraceae bacterium]